MFLLIFNIYYDVNSFTESILCFTNLFWIHFVVALQFSQNFLFS